MPSCWELLDTTYTQKQAFTFTNYYLIVCCWTRFLRFDVRSILLNSEIFFYNLNRKLRVRK